MTERTPDDVFHASSFMRGHDAKCLEQVYAHRAIHPAAMKEAGIIVADSPADLGEAALKAIEIGR